MKSKQSVLEKLKKSVGETIGETLVALLISSLALVMLASMINTTVNLVKTSKTKMNEYYAEAVKLENIPTAAKTADITISDGTLTISEGVVHRTNNKLGKDVVAYVMAATPTTP